MSESTIHSSRPSPIPNTIADSLIALCTDGVILNVCGDSPGSSRRDTSALSPAIWRTMSYTGNIVPDNTNFVVVSVAALELCELELCELELCELELCDSDELELSESEQPTSASATSDAIIASVVNFEKRNHRVLKLLNIIIQSPCILLH